MAQAHTLLYTANAQATTDAQAGEEPPNLKVPSAFGFALLATSIVAGKLDFVWVFLNRTDKEVEVKWSSSQPFDVVLEDGSGQKTHLNDYMPPASKNVPATKVLPNSQNYRVLHFDPSDAKTWRKLDFRFKSDGTPYTVQLALNSTSHRLSATVELAFAS